MRKILLLFSLVLLFSEIVTAQVSYYVSTTGDDANNGTSWGTALRNLTTALQKGYQSTTASVIIYVSEGTFKPSEGTSAIAGRGAIFKFYRAESPFSNLGKSLKVFGGYNPSTGQKSTQIGKTILSGDVGTTGDPSDNAYHVGIIGGLQGSTDSIVLDGFTIANGNADVAGTSGIHNNLSASSAVGGGLAIVSNSGANAVAVRNCIFANNIGNTGGGVNIENTSTVFDRCVFQNNSSTQAAGGGAISLRTNGIGKFTNCVFVGNTSQSAAVLYISSSTASASFIHATIFNNTVNGTNAFGLIDIIGGTFNLYNSILSDNVLGSTSQVPEIRFSNSGTGTIEYNLLQVGPVSGTGNQAADPLFVNKTDPDGADNIWGTADDGLQIEACSPAKNTGNPNLGEPEKDILFQSRNLLQGVDKGAYETPLTAPLVQMWPDADGDGFGSSTASSVQREDCPGQGFVKNNSDCNDNNAQVNPGATEICGNDIDENCNGTLNEGCTIFAFYFDGDNDGFGDPAVSTGNFTGIAPSGFVSNNTDCDDTNGNVFPGATEICGNNIDDDCDGQVDEGCTLFTFYADTDTDGFGDPNATVTNFTGITPTGYVTNNTDCNDNNAAVNPNATEVCGNNIDDDCDGLIDEGCTLFTFYVDTDTDGFGNPNASVTNFTGIAPAGFVSNSTDCNDNNEAVNPNATEVCGNNIDDDCDGQVDEGCAALTKLYLLPSFTLEGNSGSNKMIFVLTLRKKLKVPVTVSYTTANGSAIAGQDYTAKSGTVTFPANTLTRTVEISVTGDQTIEGNETLKLQLSNPVNVSLENSSADGVIINDDYASARVSDAAVAERDSHVNVKVTLSLPSPQTVRLKYSTENGSAKSPDDYTGVSNQWLVFNPGETEKYITITIKQDNRNESTEKFYVKLKGAENANILAIFGARPEATVSITNSNNNNHRSIGETETSTDAARTMKSVKVPTLLRKSQQLFITGLNGQPNELVITASNGAIIKKMTQYNNNWAPGNISQGIYFYHLRVKNEDGTFRIYSGKILVTD